MPMIKLIMHSFSIIAVFKMSVFIRSALFLVILSYLHPYIGSVSTLFQIIIVFFNILIYIISNKSNESKLQNLDSQLEDTDLITH